MAKIFINTTTPCGKCYFQDGTVEDILTYRASDVNVIFTTLSGRYQYRQWVEPEESILYADPRPTIAVVTRHGFYKFIRRGSEEIACKLVPIDKIEIRTK